MRTEREILDQTEKLADYFARCFGFKMVSGNYRTSSNSRAQKFWEMACYAQMELTGTDVLNDTIPNLENLKEDKNLWKTKQ